MTSPDQSPYVEELSDAIGIIGVSCRFPGANSVDEYWNLLCSGQDGIISFPHNRPIPKSGPFSEDDYRASRGGYLKCPIDEFDAGFFGISPRAAEQMPPQQRILLEVTWESLENAGINPERIKGTKSGVFVGSWAHEFDTDVLPNSKDLNLASRIANSFNSTAARISYHFGLRGVNIAVESGCSSSMAAIHLACESLKRKESHLAIACGVNILHEAHDPKYDAFLSNDYLCKTFDESANGFVRSEGCGVIVLKRYSDALRDHDNILCVIRGSAMNNDGQSTSFGTPSSIGQTEVMKDALKNSRVDPLDVSYVEAHGTGTAVGDPVEFTSILQAYSSGHRDHPLIIGSCKSNIGHTEASAGIAGVIKTLLCLRNKCVPPNLHLNKVNPKINLDLIPAIVPTEIILWASNKRIAGVSSFAFGGNNVHVIMQEVTDNCSDTSNQGNAPEAQIVTLSAKSSSALDMYIKNYIAFLTQKPDIDLRDIAFTSTNGRAHFDHRVAICAKSTSDLCSNLENKNFEIGQCQDTKRIVGFLFTGQGCQYANMGLSLYNNFPEFGKYFNACNAIFEKRFSLSFLDVWKSSELLQRTVYCQPSIFCIQYCLTMLWWEMGVKPDYVLGHSTGEFAAAVCAGILSLEDAMSLVLERSSLIDTVECGGMLAIKTNESNCNSLIRQFAKMNPTLWIDIAAVNSNEEIVVSCEVETVVLFSQFCSSMSVPTKKVYSSHAFHSRQMNSILDDYRKKTRLVKHNRPSCTFISSVFAKEMNIHDFDSEYWVTHLRQTVRFSEAVEIIIKKCNILIEIGPHPVLLPFAISCPKPLPDILFCPSLRRNQEDIECLARTLSKLYVAGIKINWSAWVRDVNPRRPVQLPFYPFQRKKYWIKVPDSQSYISGQLNIEKKVQHPLLGFRIPSAHIGTTFQNFIDIQSLEYLADHKITDTVIMPGMGFLEIIMAAGKQVLTTTDTSSLRPLVVENFSISTAMKLDGEKKNNLIEVIVSSDFEGMRAGQKEIKVYHLETGVEEGSESWKKHAIGVVSLCPEMDFVGTDIHTLTSGMTYHHSVAEVYQKLFNRGYNFGPTFRNIYSLWSSSSEVISEVYAPEGIGPYICHPVVLDAMLQTAAIHFVLDAENKSDKIMIPIGLGKYVWTGRKLTEKMFCHFHRETANISLYSDSGQLLASFHNVEWMSTTVSALLENLDSSSLTIPTFYTESWRLIPPLKSIDTKHLITASKSSTQTKKFISNFSGEESLVKCAKIIDNITVVYIMKAIQEFGWVWSVGQTCSNIVQDWNSRFPTELRSLKLIPSFIDILSKEGYFDKNSVVLKPLPSIAECNELIEDITYTMSTLDDSADHVTFDLVRHCGTHLTSVLKNQVSGISVLFSEDKSKPNLNDHYKKAKFMTNHADLVAAMFVDTVMQLVNERGKNCLRILEIGAGSGSASIRIHQRLSELDICNIYTYTDISLFFLQEASKNFGSKFEYKILNIEDDPLEQGFEPNQYDIIVGFLVVHATNSLTKTLDNIRVLLKPGGVLILGESFVTPYLSTITFGLLDGWWMFDDFRELSPSVNSDVWKNVLLQSGYQDIQTASIIDDHCGCLIARNGHEPYRHLTMKSKVWFIVTDESELQRSMVEYFENLNRLVISIKLRDFGTRIRHTSTSYTVNAETSYGMLALFEEFTNLDVEGILYMCTVPSTHSILDIEVIQEKLCGGILSIAQAMIKRFDSKNTKPGFILLTRGVHYVNGIDSVPGDPNMGAAWGLVKVFGVENNAFDVRLIDLDQNFSPVNCEDILSQFWTRSQDKYLAVRNRNLFVQKIVEMPGHAKPLKLPNTNRFGFYSEGSTLDDCVIRSAPVQSLKSDEVEIQSHSLSLNFKDLLVILKPDGFNASGESGVQAGMEVSGIVSAVGNAVKKFKVGDNVFGFYLSGGFSSHIVTKEDLLIHKPKHLSFSQVVALPVAVATAYVGLNKIAKLTKTDNVLVHAAAGGVGLAAVQIAKQVGAKIFATAGSHRKRNFLRSIGIKNIYNSRNTDYRKQIESDTNGVGIHVVLNSLTSEEFKEATLAICAQNARFVEISKVNIWTTANVLFLRPDIHYTVFDLGENGRINRATIDEVYDTTLSFPPDWYASFAITTFAFDQIKNALKYMMEAKHIGKIVLSMPSINPTLGTAALRYNYYAQNSSYLITGGLGGIGLEVLQWMVCVGARYIVIASSNPQDGRGNEIINSLNNSYDAHILIVQSNVGIRSDCVDLLAKIKSAGYPPLQGIMHAAGCLADGTIPNQSWEMFSQVFRAKVYGAWYLHTLTLNYGLEHFIMFSSVACIIGTRGQSNHSAANYYLDSLANYRHSLGLAASSINWGGWSEVGAMTFQRGLSDISLCVKLFSPRKGIGAFEKFIRNKYIHSCIADIDVKAVKAAFTSGSLFDQINVEEEIESKFECPLSELKKKLLKELENGNREKYSPTLKQFVEVSLKMTLRIPSLEVISQDQNFGTLGLDSLMSMEFRNILQKILGGRSLPMSTIHENPTIRTLSIQLERILTNDFQMNENSFLDDSMPSEFDTLLRQDSILPDDILAAEHGPIPASKAKNIFLTGATGLLGGYILNQLSQKNVKIYCLIRAESQKVGKERLIQSLTKLQLLDATDMINVHIVAGNTALEKFGLSCEEYSDLAAKMDIVVHVAAKVNHVEDYFQNNNSDLRTQNVFGTVNILRFACTNKTKLVLYASSIAVISKMTEDGILSEDYPDDEDYGKNLLVCDERVGYSLSKLICEKLISQANKRGIPIIAIRYPLIFGDSKSGFTVHENDHFWSMILTFLATKKVPNLISEYPLIPVDIAARVSLEILFNDNSETGVYNLTTDSVLRYEDLPEIMSKVGIKGVTLTSSAEWYKALFGRSNDSNPLARFESLYKTDGQDDVKSKYSDAKVRGKVKWDHLSSKVMHSFPGVKDIMVPSNIVVERYFAYHILHQM